MKRFHLLALAAALAVPAVAQDALAQRAGRSSSARRGAMRQAATRAPRAAAATPAGVSPRAHKEVHQTKLSMVAAIRDDSTPSFRLVANRDGVTMQQFRYGHYKENRTAGYNVSGLGSGGELHLTSLLPVSGHVSKQSTESYAKSNRYNLVVIHADGSRQSLPKVSSTGYVTEHAMTLNLKPGKTLVQFWPDGSGGVGGFKAGREIELNWDGK